MITPVASLHQATGGDLTRSLIWRDLLCRYQVGDIATSVYRDRFGCWAFLDLWRMQKDSPFAARDHHPGVGGESQPVTAPPAQRGDGHPVGDPARGVDPAEPVDHIRPAGGLASGIGRPAPGLPCRRPPGITGATGRAVMAASRAGGGGAAGSAGGREDRSPGA
jgi:hypothetical protein